MKTSAPHGQGSALRTCANCHQAIDPFGYAVNDFDPTGAWRDKYATALDADTTARRRKSAKFKDIAIDASASFRSGAEYKDIIEFRQLMQTNANRARFVRCFFTKRLTYANSEEPDDYSEVDKILAKSAENDFRIIDTVAAVIDSHLFRKDGKP